MARVAEVSTWKGSLSSSSGLAAVLVCLGFLVGIRAVAYLVPGSPPWLAPLGFVLMAVTPWVFFNRGGRLESGLTGARSRSDYLVGVLAGSVAAAVCFGVGMALFGEGADNWFVTVAATYHARDPGGLTPVLLHLVFTAPALIFSPIGEEIFFRGVLQRGLEEKVSFISAAVLQAGAFGLVHILHHGLTRGPDGLQIRGLSGSIWVLLMFATALAFTWVRRRSGSLYPAMVSHAAFNLVMNIFIFTVLWE